ncbi:MAG: helix-turn-helix transcriptional regulator [Acaryochloris sp. RU_4_1]|nr:helix-turn-helix transcriptional regulator [Leptolyngbyaceae cyanobacterium SU_3_3]NJM67398.1 helix-turn-helix transcriptional regulator [Acaryochloris sp. RU_4_1]NJR52141.1 helix-turn-helix transcriptional regulator [Leptolyngbyaceae cyanobacterium CSU_1_3]NJR62301.1 helix-turn-helix transcriptional regulator [Cyanobacteria bacterium CRU_2_1]
MTRNFISPLELGQRLNKPLVLSSRQLSWKGIIVEQFQQSSKSSFEMELPAISDHWLNLSLGQPAHLTQKHGDLLHESIIQTGDIILVPAGQPSYVYRSEGNVCCPLHICLKPELVEQVAEGADIDPDRLDLVNCFGKQDVQLHHLAMLLLAELQSGGIMGQLYVESLTQVLIVHLLRQYSTSTKPITFQNRSLTRTQLRQAIDYIHAHLDRDLSLGEIADVVNISPNYFASLFKREKGISPHQYVIQQRVEQAKLMLKKTDLAIADIALQVGFSSQSHLTQQFKRLTGMTPKQIR